MASGKAKRAVTSLPNWVASWRCWNLGELIFDPPVVRAPRELRTRLQAWLAEVAAGSRPVVAFTHKGVIHMAIAMATGWDLMSKRPYKLDWRSAHCFGLDIETLGLCVKEMNIPFGSTGRGV